MIVMRYKVFRVDFQTPRRWNWRYGLAIRPDEYDEVRDRAEAFANEVGAGNVFAINESPPPFFTVTIWYRSEGAPIKPARSGWDDEAFAGSGGADPIRRLGS